MSCQQTIPVDEVNRYLLIPSFLVTMALYSFEYFKERRTRLIPPLETLIHSKSNQKAIVFAFGTMVNSILRLIITGNSTLQQGTWSETTKNLALFLLNFLVIAAINYPTFMSIYSPYKLFASFLGLIFILLKTVFLFLEITYISCGEDVNKKITILVEIIGYLPTIVCFIALIIIFAFTFIKFLRKRQFGKVEQSLQLADDHHVKHFKELIKSRKRSPIVSPPLKISWYKKPFQKIRDIYQGTIQYSVIFLSSIAVILVLYYYLFVGLVYGATIIEKIPELIYQLYIDTKNGVPPGVTVLGNATLNSYIISMVTTFIFYTWLLVDLLQAHGRNLKRLFAGQYKEKVYNKLSAQSLTLSSILFPGYLIAHMFWGLIVFFVVILLVILIVYGFVLFLIYSPQSKYIITWCLKKIYLVFTLPLLAYILQFLLVKFVFMQNDNGNDQKKMLLKNVKIYHLTMYILFFYNLIVGLMSCIFRSIKGLMISLLVLGRIDQTPFPFLKKRDSGHRAYLGFLHLQGKYKNPVMRCFLQMLRESIQIPAMPIGVKNEFRRLEESSQSSLSSSRIFQTPDPVRGDKAIRNRWLVAYTLINNSYLMKERSHAIAARSPTPIEIDYQMDFSRDDLLLE